MESGQRLKSPKRRFFPVLRSASVNESRAVSGRPAHVAASRHAPTNGSTAEVTGPAAAASTRGQLQHASADGRLLPHVGVFDADDGAAAEQVVGRGVVGLGRRVHAAQHARSINASPSG